jgi:hypothetical protein
MPFLHWETQEDYCDELELVAQDTRKYFDAKQTPTNSADLASGTCLTPFEIQGLNGVADEKLIRLYLLQNSPLHMRRTLDQSFYNTLSDTSQRDADQVVYRYMKKHTETHFPAMLMVDQLWLWILNGGQLPYSCIMPYVPFKFDNYLPRHGCHLLSTAVEHTSYSDQYQRKHPLNTPERDATYNDG